MYNYFKINIYQGKSKQEWKSSCKHNKNEINRTEDIYKSDLNTINYVNICTDQNMQNALWRKLGYLQILRYRSQDTLCKFPKKKMQDMLRTPDLTNITQLLLYTFWSKSRMNPFECYNFDEAIDHKTVFTRRKPQGYTKLPEKYT